MKRMAGMLFGTAAMLFAGAGLAAGETEKKSAVSPPDLSTSYKSSQLMDLSVQDQKNEEIGKISELMVDKDGKVSHVVLTEGGVAGMGGNDYIVPWDRLSLSEQEQVARIDVNRDQLSSEFAAFDENIPTAGEPKSKSGESEGMEEEGKPSATNP